MNSFLKQVAGDVFRRLDGRLEHTAVVFPSKRARLFFNEYLAVQSPHPLWAPTYFTMGELFAALSPLRLCDPLECVCRLYPLYCQAVEAKYRMELDAFFPWGERLLKDFNDLDKHLVDADRLFANLSAMERIDMAGGLSPEQQEAVKRFYSHYSEQSQTELKAHFAAMWNALLPMYRGLNSELQARGMAYEGALFRHVVTHLDDAATTASLHRYEHYVVVGFNLLSEAEQALFRKLQDEGRALFYWDYDPYYAGKQPHEAGLFVRRNLKAFPSPLDRAEDFDNFARDKELRIVAAQSNSEQASYCADWLRANMTAVPRETAVVLCDENSLLPVLHALPPQAGPVNVTKGYPTSHTQAARLIEQELAAHATGADDTPKAQLQLLASLRQAVEQLATSPDAHHGEARSDRLLSDLKKESCYQCYTLLGQVQQLVAEGLLIVRTDTLQRLLTKLVRAQSVPFHGEPAVGLQVLGMLETRCLSFDHLIMLHVNEGTMPPAPQKSSFIPYEIRRAFGMTTAEHEESIYAYYFYRLVARARRVTFVYNAHATGGQTGEMSHFLLQLLLESGRNIELVNTASPIDAMRSPLTGREAFLSKTDSDERAERQKLLDRIDASTTTAQGARELSPSAINTWLTCRLRFYFRYIEHLPQPDPPADSIQLNRLGSVFHRTAELFYRHLTHSGANRHITTAMLAPYVKEAGLRRRFVMQAFKDEGVENILLVDRVVSRLFADLVKYDSEHKSFDLVAMECDHALTLPIDTPWGERQVRVGGFIDRIDRIQMPDGTQRLRVVDYKTGGKMEAPASLDELFRDPETTSRRRAHYALQTFIYSLALSLERDEDVCPSLLFVHHFQGKDFSPYISLGGEPATSIRAIEGCEPLGRGELSRRLKETVEAIFADDPETAYLPTTNEDNCRSCPYQALCGRR